METSQMFGTEKISKVLLKMAPPVMLAQLIQALYNIVDSLFIGRYAESGLTALSIIYPIQLLMIALAVGTGVGINTVMAARLGTGQKEEADEYAGVGTPLAIAMWFVFALVCWLTFPVTGLVTTLVGFVFYRQFIAEPYREGTKKRKRIEHKDVVIQPSKPGVIITIAREHGSSGKQIGKLVAEKLGIPFYYKEMTALAAQESGLAQEFISDINQNAPKVLHDLYLSTTVVQHAIAAQHKVIERIAENGSCVIVGRAADHVLRERKDVVRIFVYAPEDYRISRVMEVYGDTREEAERNVRRSDTARAAYYRSISGRDWGNRSNYDLMVDSSIGIRDTADVICRYIASKRSK